MAELGPDVNIPDLWRMSALLEVCPRGVREATQLSLDEIGEGYANMNANIIGFENGVSCSRKLIDSSTTSTGPFIQKKRKPAVTTADIPIFFINSLSNLMFYLFAVWFDISITHLSKLASGKIASCL